MNAEVLAAIRQSDAIPALPQLAVRLLEITRDQNYDQDELVGLLSTDPGIAGDLIRLSNSSLFGMARKVGSLRHAVGILGLKRTRTLVLGRCMIARASQDSKTAVDGLHFWRRSLSTAVLAARFAEQALSEQREEAFMAGLLSDIGVTVLSRAVSNRYAPVAMAYATLSNDELLNHEMKRIGTIHPVVSALVMERWLLPTELVTAIRHHHEHELPPMLDTERRLAGIVNAASRIAWLLCSKPQPAEILRACRSAVEAAGLTIAELHGALAHVEADISELATVLRIEIVADSSASRIIEMLNQELLTAAS